MSKIIVWQVSPLPAAEHATSNRQPTFAVLAREILQGLDIRTCIVVVEETIQSRAIDQDVLRIHNPQTPAISAVAGNAAR